MHFFPRIGYLFVQVLRYSCFFLFFSFQIAMKHLWLNFTRILLYEFLFTLTGKHILSHRNTHIDEAYTHNYGWEMNTHTHTRTRARTHTPAWHTYISYTYGWKANTFIHTHTHTEANQTHTHIPTWEKATHTNTYAHKHYAPALPPHTQSPASYAHITTGEKRTPHILTRHTHTHKHTHTHTHTRTRKCIYREGSHTYTTRGENEHTHTLIQHTHQLNTHAYAHGLIIKNEQRTHEMIHI